MARVAAIAVAIAVAACSDAKKQPAPTPTPTDWQVDIDYLAEELPKRHVNLFFRLSEDEFRARVAALRQRAPDLTDAQVIVELLRIVAAVGDGHTRMDAMRKLGRVPLRLMSFDEGVYVVAVGADHEWSHGRRVVRIGGRDIDRVVAEVTALISHDNESHLRAQLPAYLTATELLAALGLEPRYTLAAPDGTTRELALTTGSPAAWTSGTGTTPPLYLKNPQAPYWNAPVEGAVYLQYNQCVATGPDMSFADLAAGTLGYLDEHDVGRLVIDLRHNGGGNSRVIAPLVAGLAARDRFATRGAVMAIIGRGTFSSAVLNAIELRDSLGAVLVGEPTGGKPNHYGEVKTLTLPRSGTTVWYSTKLFQMVPGDPDAVHPDVPVPVTAAAYFAGQDPALAAALAYE